MPEESRGGAARPRRESVDNSLKLVVVILVGAVLGLGGFLGYTVWRTGQVESTSTPALRALGELEKFVKSQPNSAAGRVRYGEALATAGKLKEAAEQFKAAIKLDEKHTGAWLDLGLVAMQSDERPQAKAYFEKVVELTEGADYESINQRRGTALFHLGEISLDARLYEEAAGYFKAALRIRKDSSTTYYLLANALHGLGDDEAAVEQLDAALAFDPNYAEAHYLYGLIYLEREDPINAAVHLRKALDLAPDSEVAQKGMECLGTVKQAIQKSEDALKAKRVTVALESALLAREIDPKSVDAVLAHARALEALGDEKALKAVLGEALKLDPNNAEAKKMTASLKN
jgi:tetratricopeptide (TPR) repeat protein